MTEISNIFNVSFLYLYSQYVGTQFSITDDGLVGTGSDMTFRGNGEGENRFTVGVDPIIKGTAITYPVSDLGTWDTVSGNILLAGGGDQLYVFTGERTDATSLPENGKFICAINADGSGFTSSTNSNTCVNYMCLLIVFI